MSLLPKFTDAGKALQLRALDGEEIRFTKIQMGSGNLGETSYKTFNALLEPKVTIPITDITISDGYAAIRGYFNNEKLTEGFYYRELGLFAQDPDDSSKEILYCYGNSGEHASYIAEPGSVLIERSIKIIAVVDDAENVSAVINGSAVYVDFVELRKSIEAHNSDRNAHSDMFGQSLTCHFDCSTTEDETLRNGTIEHPYKTIDEFFLSFGGETIPNTVKELYLKFKNTGTYRYGDLYINGGSLDTVSIIGYGSGSARPKFDFEIALSYLRRVYIVDIEFKFNNSREDTISFYECDNVYVRNVDANHFAQVSHFIQAQSSGLNIKNVASTNVSYSVFAGDASRVTIEFCNFDSKNADISLANSTAFLYCDDELTFDKSSDSLIFTSETIRKITDGVFIDHLDKKDNPHNVSLSQAQRVGGTIDVSHGGTGQTQLTSGAILKGNGTGNVSFLSGTGALYSSSNNSPQFGTLPVSCGGTGLATLTKGSLLKGNGTGVVDGVKGTGALYATTEGAPLFGTLPVSCGGTGRNTLTAKGVLLGNGASGVNAVTNAAGAFHSNGTDSPGFGTLPVSSGGTGQTTLASGGILKGNGTGGVGVIRGTGALYATASGSPSFGVLPISCGGTGQSSIFSQLNSEVTNGVHRGAYVFPGSNILLLWGRVDVEAGYTYDNYFNSWHGAEFNDANYVLIFTNHDISNSDVTKYADHFHIEKQTIGARVGDWFAIGMLKS